MLLDNIDKWRLDQRVLFSAFIGPLQWARPCIRAGENSKYDMIPALKKFHLVAVVLGSEDLMKAIQNLCCHEV